MSLDDFPQVLVALENNRDATYSILASYAWLLHDHVLTLGQEIELIWPTPWSLGKGLYFVTKYLPLLDGAMLIYFHTAPPSIAVHTCTILFKVTGWMDVLGILFAELILVFRTWALWGRNSKLAIGLLLLLFALAIPTSIFAYVGLVGVEFGSSPSPKVESCWISKNPGHILFIDYILIVVFESVILGLTIYKGKGMQRLRYSNSNLVVTLYRDGVLYFIYLIVFSLVNIVILVAAPKPGPSLRFMQRVLHSILTARILLNLREAVSRDRAKRAMATTSSDNAPDCRETGQLRTGLSSVIIGMETWFRDTNTTTRATLIEMARREPEREQVSTVAGRI